jgi:glycyl-tRNA synthetase
MFKTEQGIVEGQGTEIYLRPETAQGIFVNFKNILDTTRSRIPFGIAQIGKSFRNEITPGNFMFRVREFYQMEIEYFIENDEKIGMKRFEEWKKASKDRWINQMGINEKKLKFRDHDKDELSFYSKGTCDVEYEFPR